MLAASTSQPLLFSKMEPVNYDDLFKKHSWSDPSEVNIEQYFAPEELAQLCEYEKDRLRNIKRNYEMMLSIGLPAKKPHFMVKNRPKFSIQEPVESSSSESDEEWTPTKVDADNRNVSKKHTWKAPVKKQVTKKASSVKGKKTTDAAKSKLKERQAVKRTIDSSTKNGTPVASKKSPKDACDEIKALFESDDEAGGTLFEGFTASEIEESERRLSEVLARNAQLLAQLESDEFCLEVEDQEGDEDEDIQETEDVVEPVTEAEVTERESGSGDRTRYPRRSAPRKNYAEEELPKDDDFLYCEDCNEDYEGDCPIHGPLIIIEDTKVPNDGSDPNRAEHSIPKGLTVRKSKIPQAGEGIWTQSKVPRGVRFGPYEGVKVDDSIDAHKSGYCWVIYKDGGVISHYVDAQNKSYANWLRFVNCARNEWEQNLLAYQYKGSIYYRTIKEIPPGCELLVWYGHEYAKELGITEEGEETNLHELYISAGFEVWQCDVCTRIFPSQSWMMQHRRQHGDQTGTKRHKCPHCNYSTDDSGHYQRHMRKHTGERPYTCSVCGSGFNQAGNLKRHMRKHTGERPYTCTVCGSGFTRSGDLKTHMRTHTGERPYTCTVCGSGFTISGHLKTHMRTHTGERPYTCTVCGSGFTISGHLKKHMRKHTGERPYTCTVCGSGFTISGHLKTHMRTHTGERPYTCTVCGSGFTISGHLKKHMRTHMGSTPFSCHDRPLG